MFDIPRTQINLNKNFTSKLFQSGNVFLPSGNSTSVRFVTERCFLFFLISGGIETFVIEHRIYKQTKKVSKHLLEAEEPPL